MIMDGNQRWSKKNKLSLKDGYLEGLNKIREIINICIEYNLSYLTIYALSSENIKRASVVSIFDIMIDEYEKLLNEFKANKEVKIKIIGEKNNLPKKIINILNGLEQETMNNNKLHLNIAFNYGTDKELISIFNNIVRENKIKNINEEIIKQNMYLSNIPDPDLLIRTGGHQRLSNFLLLKLSYTELFFTKTLWPDLSKKEIISIFENFMNIERKYGL